MEGGHLSECAAFVVQKAKTRLRDPASWLPLAAGGVYET